MHPANPLLSLKEDRTYVHLFILRELLTFHLLPGTYQDIQKQSDTKIDKLASCLLLICDADS